jgi:uroporphyrinogen decarboxylase
MLQIPIKNPEPDFNNLVNVLNGSENEDRVLFAEILIDEEIKKYIIENYFNDKNIPPPVSSAYGGRSNLTHNEKKKAYESYYKQVVNFYFRMGYSLYVDVTFDYLFASLNTKTVHTRDTATLSRGDRQWAVEGIGIIRSWEDFEKFPWKKAEGFVIEYEGYLETISKILPSGMKIGVLAVVFEAILEWILGYQGFFYMIYDQPDLVEAVFNKVGGLIYEFYRLAVSSDVVGCIWHSDDLGYKSSTMISPELLNKLVFPWFKKYASIAHKYSKPFYLHCCGKKDQIMDSLIENVKIDAIHSFEDNSSPVVEFKERWGKSVGIIGGVDVDKLARLSEVELRIYVKSVLDICMQGGRYVFGSGNTIANYIPVDNYLIMMDEGVKWEKK